MALAAVSLTSACGRPCAPLEIVRGEVVLARLCVTRTATEAELRRGLSGREALAPDEALVLVFPLEGELCISNASVSFPIDAAFVDARGSVVAIERELPAGDPRSLCHAPTLEVLETASGALRDVQPGDLIAE